MTDWFEYEKAATKRIAELKAKVARLEKALRMIETGDCDYPEQVAGAALEGRHEP